MNSPQIVIPSAEGLCSLDKGLFINGRCYPSLENLFEIFSMPLLVIVIVVVVVFLAAKVLKYLKGKGKK